MRVITDNIEISNDRKKLEENADFSLLGLNAIKQTSKLARKGDLRSAQINAKAWNNKLSSNSNQQ